MGSQTGVGVLFIDNMRTLHATLQLIYKIDKSYTFTITRIYRH